MKNIDGDPKAGSKIMAHFSRYSVWDDKTSSSPSRDSIGTSRKTGSGK
jgi:hypothetical protein